ncbi:glycosyltransferase family 2 protein [Asticcacaulis sp. AC402]|uniref:glycosyltransferase family 2 protein n=1 Tax=Asticcacaulis sp. AC402 TaxID=1282361 RepID=UPI0003C3B1A5|nr:glycosyltransferase family 2 protein [Asticcacaulis sp. AC402]ESQ74877.1 hypothetical protein ABAC402_12040 [Asticcacaulis sp. AC402]
MTVALVAIAKNESRFITEWLAYHLRLGFDKVIVYDNESDDDTGRILDTLAAEYPIERIPWPYEPGKSPQIAAYNDALTERLAGFDWVAFIDCDEFLMLHDDADMTEFLARFGPEVGAVALNWVTFGSGGRLTSDYELVTDAFRTGPDKHFSNNCHIKTLARVSCVEWMWIHHADLRSGKLVHASGVPVKMTTPGIADVIDHSVAQLNHYQAKSREDYNRKIARGRAGAESDHPERIRTDGEEIWALLDQNDHRHDEMDARLPLFLPMYEQFKRILTLP